MWGSPRAFYYNFFPDWFDLKVTHWNPIKFAVILYRQAFQDICARKVTVPGLQIMRDVAIAKSEFISGEKAITKLQDFQIHDPLFDYCTLPEVKRLPWWQSVSVVVWVFVVIVRVRVALHVKQLTWIHKFGSVSNMSQSSQAVSSSRPW